MSVHRRAQLEQAYLLHQRPWRESSLIVDFFASEYGRLALVAKGARRPKSAMRGVLQPFCLLAISFSQRSELGTLTAAESAQRPVIPPNESLLSAYYVNELILRLLARNDPHGDLFAHYSETINRLSAGDNPAPVLRIFEKRLLQALGYGLELHCDVRSGEQLDPLATYEYRLEQGPVATLKASAGSLAFSGRSLIALAAETLTDPESIRDARRLLMATLDLYLNDRPLNTRKVMRAMRR